MRLSTTIACPATCTRSSNEYARALFGADAIAFGHRVAVDERAERLCVSHAPIARDHLGAVGPEPFEIFQLTGFRGTAAEPSPAPENRMLAPDLDQPPRELDQRRVRVLPIDPRNWIVLAVGVVVAALCATELVTVEDHGH